MIVVDYLQLMYADEKHDSREREIADMSRSMKRLSVEMGCPVLLLSQLNRKAEEGNREPQLSDLRESGAIEQDADIVIMLHADKRDQSEKNVPMQALVRKGRSSGTGAADLLFEKQFSDFRVNDGYRPDFDRREAFDL
jgi:replicative DNA helicase